MSEPGVSVDAIGRAPIEHPVPEKIPANVDPLTGQDKKLNQHLGRVGQFIGGGPEKAGNIAYIVIVAAFIVLILSIIAAYVANGDKLAPILDKIATGSFSIITGAVGYIFGSSKDSK